MMKPAINAVRLKRIEVGRESTVLLDGGATNCMRKAKSWKEYEEGLPVQVSLASGTAEMRQHRESGTLLVMQDVQPIVPVSDLVKIGVTVEWSATGCVMSQAGRKLPVYLDGGCPVIGMREGMQLMEQVEAFYMRRSRLRVAAVRAEPNQQDLEMVEAANFADNYPQVPLRLVERIPGRVRWDPELVPLNRRMRKRLQRAKSIVIHLFSGTNTEIWDSHDQEGLVFLNIEIKRGTDMHNDHLFGFLEQLCQSGRVRGVFAGPPCRTVSLLRFQQEEGGPKPLRGRENEARFGLPWLSEEEQREADDDSVLWLRTLQLMTVALDESVECAIGLEQPEDPANWKEDDANLHGGWGYPSFMVWPETVAFAQLYGLDFVNFDQKLLGHKRKKPTTMVTNIGTIKALQGRRSTTPDPPWPRTLRERMEESAGLAEWATGLQILLREVAVLLHGRAEQRRQRKEAIRYQAKRSVWTMRPDRMQHRMMALSMKDQEELAEWQRHVDNDHKPYRRDCEECLRSMGRDRMRKRIECPDSYALNLDIMGPVNRGEDQDGTGFYYELVGAFTVPCVGDNPIAQGLQELGHGQPPHIMADEEASHRPWTSKDVVDKIEELKKQYGADYVQDINTGEDNKKEDHKPGEHRGGDVHAVVQDPPQHGPQDEPPEDSIDDLFADLPSEEQEQWTPIEIQAWDAMNRRWQDKVAELKNVKVTSLTFAIPMRSRHSHEVVRALSLMYGKIRSLNLPLIRIHTDRAREFLARPVQQWMQSRNVMQTVAAGDEAQGSGRVEREVQYIKETTRLLLSTTRAPVSWWPLAMRQATEMRHRKQLQALGVPQLPLIPFGTSCMAKVKRWHKRDGEEGKWRYPMRKVVVWGPASDMSSTSRGYYIQAGDQWMKTTVVVIPNCRHLHDLRPQLPQPPMAMMDDMEYEYGTQERGFEAAAEEFPASLEVGEQGEVPGHMPEALFVEQPPHCGEVPRRIHGKTPPDQVHESYTADVRTLQVRGEWSMVTNEEVMKNQYVVEEERMVQGVCELQHRELRKLEIEERYLIGETEENFGHLVHEVAQESRRLEARLASLQAQEGDQQKNQEIEETLVNRQVDLAEVRRDLADWTEAIDKEYRSLRGYNAIEPISEEQYLELQRTMDYIEVIPSMLVTVVKPPNRKKARIVACGNHSAPNPHDALGTTAGGLDSIVVRAMVSVAAEREWNVYSSDIATAFLQAERRSLPGRATVVVPPTIVKDSNVMEFGHQERWLVRKALYGLAESPKDWARHRDRLLQDAAWSDEGGRRWKMTATPECHLWRIEEEGSQQAHAYLGVYVDDLLMVGEDEVCESAMKFLATKFQMQPYEKVTTEKGIVFCGYEIEKEANGDYVLYRSRSMWRRC